MSDYCDLKIHRDLNCDLSGQSNWRRRLNVLSPDKSFCYTDESGETYEIFIESKSNPEITETGGSGREGRGSGPTSIQIQEASRMIRGYAAYAVGAFKNFSAAKIDGVTLKFGLKIGGKVGIPYITEGSTESNLEIEVKCSFPDNP